MLYFQRIERCWIIVIPIFGTSLSSNIDTPLPNTCGTPPPLTSGTPLPLTSGAHSLLTSGNVCYLLLTYFCHLFQTHLCHLLLVTSATYFGHTSATGQWHNSAKHLKPATRTPLHGAPTAQVSYHKVHPNTDLSYFLSATPCHAILRTVCILNQKTTCSCCS